jgi:hypothetical protein
MINCEYCMRQPVRGVVLCSSPHWEDAGDIRWRSKDGTARVIVEETCKLCEHKKFLLKKSK